MNNQKCGQMRCTFNIMAGCQACSVCNAPPNIVDDNCDKCHNCQFDEGLLRWDDNSDVEKESEAEKDKEKEKELKSLEIKTS